MDINIYYKEFVFKQIRFPLPVTYFPTNLVYPFTLPTGINTEAIICFILFSHQFSAGIKIGQTSEVNNNLVVLYTNCHAHSNAHNA